MFDNDISIDLGTATMLVYIRNKGIVLREPTVIAVNTKTNEVCAVGKEALRMLGRTPPHIQAVRPLIDGVISNLTLTEEMIKYFFKKILSRTIGRPRIMMCVPSGVTDENASSSAIANSASGPNESAPETDIAAGAESVHRSVTPNVAAFDTVGAPFSRATE